TITHDTCHPSAPVHLDHILADRRARLAAEKASVSLADLEVRLADAPPPRDFAGAVRGPSLRAIAEVKRASPSAGPIRPDADPAAVAAEYEAAGAAAVSVLTEERFSGGARGPRPAARARAAPPVLRKDFIVDEWQLLEARAAGADAALLIVAALDDRTLARLVARAGALGLAALVEVHDEEEARRAAGA